MHFDHACDTYFEIVWLGVIPGPCFIHTIAICSENLGEKHEISHQVSNVTIVWRLIQYICIEQMLRTKNYDSFPKTDKKDWNQFYWNPVDYGNRRAAVEQIQSLIVIFQHKVLNKSQTWENVKDGFSYSNPTSSTLIHLSNVNDDQAETETMNNDKLLFPKTIARRLLL